LFSFVDEISSSLVPSGAADTTEEFKAKLDLLPGA